MAAFFWKAWKCVLVSTNTPDLTTDSVWINNLVKLISNLNSNQLFSITIIDLQHSQEIKTQVILLSKQNDKKTLSQYLSVNPPPDYHET